MRNAWFFIRALWCIAWADCLIFWRYPVQVIGSWIWPLLFAGSSGFLARGLAGPNGEGVANFESLADTSDYLSFVIVGSMFFAFLNQCLWSGGLCLSTARQQGILETHWLTPGRSLTFVFGKTLASLLQQVPAQLSLLVVMGLLGLIQISGSVWEFLIIGVVSTPFILGVLVLFSAITLRAQEGGYVILVVRTLLSILGGFSFPLAVLPESVQKISQWLPLTHILEMFRGSCIYGRPLDWNSVRFVFISGVGLCGVAVVFFLFLERWVRKKGLISGY